MEKLSRKTLKEFILEQLKEASIPDEKQTVGLRSPRQIAQQAQQAQQAQDPHSNLTPPKPKELQRPISRYKPEPKSAEEQKRIARQNIIRQLTLLKYTQSALKDVNLPPELQNMITSLQKLKTATFLKEVLGIPLTIEVNVESLLTNPLNLISSVITHLLDRATQTANQKLQETHQPTLTDSMNSLNNLSAEQ